MIWLSLPSLLFLIPFSLSAPWALVLPFCCCCLNRQAHFCLRFVVKALCFAPMLSIRGCLIPIHSGHSLNVTSAEHSAPPHFLTSHLFGFFKTFKITWVFFLLVIFVIFSIFPEVECKLHKNRDLVSGVCCFIPSIYKCPVRYSSYSPQMAVELLKCG